MFAVVVIKKKVTSYSTSDCNNRYCSVVTVTFTSRDIEKHVLERVRHLVNRIVVFWSIVCFLLLRTYYRCMSESYENEKIYIYTYLSEFARRWPLKFSLEHGQNPCSSHCGRSKWRGLAVKACFSKQPRDSSNSGWVTLSCVSKAQSWGGVLLGDLNCN